MYSKYLTKEWRQPLWKGILKVVEKLKSSFRWKISNDEKIRFWEDVWCNDSALSTRVPYIDPQDLKLTLSQVINEDGEWKFSKLQTGIPQDMQEEIKGTSVCLIADLDRIVWNETASGKFSCQSAYKVLRQQSQRFNNNQIEWSIVWKIRLTNKMKHFLWLAVQERLNTNSLRFKRQITNVATCSQCNRFEESAIHIFRHCCVAKDIWKDVVDSEDWRKFNQLTNSAWFKHNLQKSFKNRLRSEACWLAIFVATIWNLWKSRNEAVFRGSPNSKNRTLFLIRQISEDLQLKMDPKSVLIKNQKWVKPPANWKKLNVDGSVRTYQSMGAIGCVLRDDKENWMWGFAAPIRQPTVNESEIISLLRGLERA